MSLTEKKIIFLLVESVYFLTGLSGYQTGVKRLHGGHVISSKNLQLYLVSVGTWLPYNLTFYAFPAVKTCYGGWFISQMCPG